MTAKTSRKIMRNFALEEEIITLMDDTGADFFFHLPEKFDLVKGSPLFCAGVTTYYPMEKYLTPDMKKTAVIGIGGLGHVAVKFLKKLGYDVTAFTSSEKKIDMIKELGADHVVVSTDP